MQVIGMGEEKTPQPFISACNQFKYLDLLYNNQQETEKEESAESAERHTESRGSESAPSKRKNGNRKSKDLKKVRHAINAIIDKFSDEDGWLSSGKLGDQLSKRLPDFDVRNYGFSKLTLFIKSLGDYEIQKISTGNGQKQIYFRLKAGKTEKE